MTAAAKVSPLSAHLGYWLRYVSNHVSHAFHERLEHQGVTVAEWVVMREMFDQHALTPSELAKRLGMTRGAISKLSARLIDKDMVARTFSTSDRRVQTLALTREGRRLVPLLARAADENDAQFFGALTHTEADVMRKALQKIAGRLEKNGVAEPWA